MEITRYNPVRVGGISSTEDFISTKEFIAIENNQIDEDIV